MTKKRFSLLIDDEDTSTPKAQEQYLFTPKKSIDTNRPRLSIMDNEEEEKPERIPFKRKLTYWLIQNKTVFLHRTYGININYNNEKSIQYLLEIKCDGYKKGIFTYSLIRKRFFKDGKQLEGILEELAAQSASCLYPLKINVNEEGQLIAVTNQKDIQKRWEALKPELSKRYMGKPFATYCKRMDEVVSNPKKILRSLDNDVVYDILFSKLYFNYSKAFTQPLGKEFKWFSGTQKVRFTGNQTVDPILKENMRMCMEYKGTMQPMGNLSQGHTNIKYQLDSKDHTLLRVDGTFNYTNNTTNKIIAFKAIWQQHMDKTKERKIEDQKRKGTYIAPGDKWWQFWK